MTPTGYAILKTHFDQLFTKGHYGNGLEHIRDVYRFAFDTKINLYDVHQTSFRVANNPISRIVTLIGPRNDELQKGIIPCIDSISCVNFFDKKYLMGLTEDNIVDYAGEVYAAMDNVLSADPMYNLPDGVIVDNPYLIFLRCCPLYFTYHHILTTDPDLIGKCTDTFTDFLERRGICDSTEEAKNVIRSIATSKYSTTFEGIYSTLTCKNTVKLFY